MTNEEFKLYKYGKNCASEYISECINKSVNFQYCFTKKQVIDVLRDKIKSCNADLKDNNNISFNTGYKEVINDFLTFITK